MKKPSARFLRMASEIEQLVDALAKKQNYKHEEIGSAVIAVGVKLAAERCGGIETAASLMEFAALLLRNAADDCITTRH